MIDSESRSSGYPAGANIRHACHLGIYELFCEQVAQRASKIAVEDVNHRFSYVSLRERVEKVAAVFKSYGVKQGDRIAVLSENRSEYIEVVLAASKIGAIVACQNWRLTVDELNHCVGLVSPSILVCSDRYSDAASDVKACNGIPQIHFGNDYEKKIADAEISADHDFIDPESGLIILYTSGTTGPAKAALLSHRTLLSRMMLLRCDYGVDCEDSYLAWPPMFHMGGTEHSLSTLMIGGTVVVSDGFDIPHVIDTLTKHKLSWLLLVPGIVERLINALGSDVRPIKGVKFVGAMADLLSKETISEITSLVNAPFLNTFGSTETGLGPCSLGTIPVGVRPETLAKQKNTMYSVRLIDPGTGDAVPAEKPGEVLVRGPTLFNGYWGASEINEDAFRDGWFRMGDILQKHDDGSFDYVGRAKYLIKSGGENIYPAEIENILLSDSRIADAVVVKKYDQKWGEIPVAVIAKSQKYSEENIDKGLVDEMCLKRLAKYKRPKEVYFIEYQNLPRSATGKIIREEVEKMILDPLKKGLTEA